MRKSKLKVNLKTLIRRCCARLPQKQHDLAERAIMQAHLAGNHCIGFPDKKPVIQDISNLYAIDSWDGSRINLFNKYTVPKQHELFIKCISDSLITRSDIWTKMIVFADYLEEQCDSSCQGWRWIAKFKRKAFDQSARYRGRSRKWRLGDDEPCRWTFTTCDLEHLEEHKSNIPFHVGTHRIQFNAYQFLATKFVVWAKEVKYSW